MPISETRKLTIRSEEEAWRYLDLALKNEIPQGVEEITFDNWPTIGVRLEGPPFQATITTKNMEGFIELQHNIYRSYAVAVYGGTVRDLSKKEKEALSFSVKVTPGSSALDAVLGKTMIAFAEGVAKNVDSTAVIVIALGTGLLWAGVSSWKAWLEHLRKTRAIQAEEFAGGQETQRMQIMAQALTKQPVLVQIKADSENTYRAMLKSYGEAETVHIAGHEIEQPIVEEILRGSRSKANSIRIDRVFRIKRVDSSNSEEYRVDIYDHSGGDPIAATVEDRVVKTGRNKAILQQAEWDRKPVLLSINAREINGQIKDAVIVGISVHEEPATSGQAEE